MDTILLNNTTVTDCKLENTSFMTDKQGQVANLMMGYIISLHKFALECECSVAAEQIKVIYHLKKHNLLLKFDDTKDFEHFIIYVEPVSDTE